MENNINYLVNLIYKNQYPIKSHFENKILELENKDNIEEKKESIQEIKKNKCFVCKKKVGLDYFLCDCNKNEIFCTNHRYPFAHNCSKEIKKENQNRLKELNPKIVVEKFERI
jgi:hypothetical protein